MSLAKLQLERYRLGSLAVQFNDAWLALDDEQAGKEEYDCRPEFDVLEGEEGDFLVSLSLECAPPAGSRDRCRFTSVAATVWGIFSLAEGTAEEEGQRLVMHNGVAILHGIVRGLLVSATGGCVGGPFILPAINYVELFRRKAEELEEASAEEEKAEDTEEGNSEE